MALQRMRRYLVGIGDIRRSNQPLQQYLGFTAGRLIYDPDEHKADSLIAKFKEAGGTVREIDV